MGKASDMCIGIGVHADKGTGAWLSSAHCLLFRIFVLRC